MTKKPTRPAIGPARPGQRALYLKESEYPSLKRQEELMENPNAHYALGEPGAIGKELGHKYDYFGKRIQTKKEQRLASEQKLAPVRRKQTQAKTLVKTLKAKRKK